MGRSARTPRHRRHHLDAAVHDNVQGQLAALRKSTILRTLEEEGALTLVGAYYDLDSGEVDFLPSEPPQAAASGAPRSGPSSGGSAKSSPPAGKSTSSAARLPASGKTEHAPQGH